MNFDFTSAEAVVFGICTRQRRRVGWYDVPVSSDVKGALVAMAQGTDVAMRNVSESPTAYEASEKYRDPEHLSLRLDDPVAAFFAELRQVNVLEPGGIGVLRQPRTVVCYFAKIHDRNGRVLLGVRRSTSFKGVLKHKPWLVSLVSDELRLVQEDLFRLDNDFDVLIDDEHTFVLHVAGFESIGKLQNVIKNAAYGNVQALRDALPFVEFGDVNTETIGLAVARRLAAVKQQQLDGITPESLRNACDEHRISYTFINGVMEFEVDSLVDVLDILDRRLYVDKLVPDTPARYRAGSRSRRA